MPRCASSRRAPMAEAVPAGILGIGSYLPPQVRTNDFWPSTFTENIEQKRNKDFLAIERSSDGQKTEIPPEIAAAMAALGTDPFFGARRRHVLDDDAETS